jgi:hypothetical protein
MGNRTVSDSILNEILGKSGGEVGGAGDAPDEQVPDEQGEDSSLVVACEELLQAIRRNDPKALADSLRSALTLADEPERDYSGGCVGRGRR